MSRHIHRLSPKHVAAIVAVAVASQQRSEDSADAMSGWQLRGRDYQRWSARPRTWAERSRREQLTER